MNTLSISQEQGQPAKLSYSAFSLDKVRKKFGIEIAAGKLFAGVSPVAPTEWLQASLQRARTISLISEKARSEFIVAPILLELKERLNNQISIYSGARLDVAPEEGLQGVCDFIVSRGPPLPTLRAPLLVMVEAKKNDIEEGLGQCAAEMIAAQRFNAEEGQLGTTMYGCVTTGELWQFLQLADTTLVIDSDRLYIEHVDRILGVLIKMAT